jgi:sialate O-acetylesterase
MMDLDSIDLFNVPSWGVDEPTGEELIAFVEEALERGTGAVFMFHSVGGGYLNVSAGAHEVLLRYLDKHSDDIWTSTFMEVTEYIALTRESDSSPR